MEVFHALGVGSNLEALRLMDGGRHNFLVSAWTWHERSEMRRLRALIREKAKMLVVDSGFISAARAGCLDWVNRQEYVVEVAHELGADRVSLLDVPMAPELLAGVGLTPAQALSLTVRNAEAFSKMETSAAKGYVNQGWTLEDRRLCLEALSWAPAAWWGVGTIAMRKPPDLYEHVAWVRERVPGHLHCFGISHPEWARRLRELGADSCDSSSAAMTAAWGRVMVNGRQVDPVKGEHQRRNQRVQALDYWRSMECIEFEVQRVDGAGHDEGSQQLTLQL